MGAALCLLASKSLFLKQTIQKLGSLGYGGSKIAKLWECFPFEPFAWISHVICIVPSTYLACCLPCLGSTACQITNYSSRDKRYAFYSNISSDQYFQPQHPISVICFMCSFITPLQTALLSFLCNLPATRDYDGGAVFQIILSLIASFLHYKMFNDVFSSIKISDWSSQPWNHRFVGNWSFSIILVTSITETELAK